MLKKEKIEMNTTPRRSKPFFRSVKRQDNKTDEEGSAPAHSTPNSKHPDSPLHFPLTQENENEVVWDWQSPRQTKKIVKTKLQSKRNDEGARSPSVAVPFKRKNILNKINNLKEKLDAINQQINKKVIVNAPNKPQSDEKNNYENLLEDDDDSVTDILVQCSQQVENEYLKSVQQFDSCTNNREISKLKNINLNVDSKFGDDSFDQFLGTVEDDVIESLSQVPCKNNQNTVITIQNVNRKQELPCSTKNCVNSYNSNHEDGNKISNFQRTNSFELDIQSNSCSPPLKCTPEEIEKKRRDALAKRERKMMERPKSSMGVDGEVTPSRKFQRRNYSFEIPSPSMSKHKYPRQKSSERLDEVVQDVKMIKDWEKIQREIERKRKEAISRLQRKKIKK